MPTTDNITDDAETAVSSLLVREGGDRPVIVDGPRDNDVILGRGFHAREFRGTKRYRDLLHERAADYAASTTREDKDQVAIQVIRSIQANGGRFLQQLQPSAEGAQKRGISDTTTNNNNDDDANNYNDATKTVHWMELETHDLLRRTKQALRDTWRKKSQSAFDKAAASERMKQRPALQPLVPYPPAVSEVPPTRQQESLSNHFVRQPPLASSSRGLFSYADTANPNNTISALFDPETHPGLGRRRTAAMPEVLESHPGPDCEGETLHKRKRDDDGLEELEDLPCPWQDTSDTETSSSDQATYTDDEKEAAEFLLNLLTEGSSRLPRMTLEDVQREKLQLTEEERQAVLADMFGDMCMISHRDKRTRRPEPGTIKALLREMRSEIDKLAEKPALQKAMHDASPHEFYENRLEMFLHCEKKDPKKAAERFVAYWEFRREWFGEEKFCLPLTLDGAFRDDHAALEVGYARLIPGLDVSGRQIIYFAKVDQSLETSTVLRAMWYVFEAALEHTNAARGIVIVIAINDGLWDVNMRLSQAATTMVNDILPVSICATHLVDLPFLVRRVFFPVWSAFAGKSMRNRYIDYDAPGARRMEKFGSYGISEDLVPVELGGKCKLDHSAWLFTRRALGK